MEKNKLTDLIAPILVLLGLVAFYDPFMVLMPTAAILCALGVFVAAGFTFVLYLWREKVRDEREVWLRFHSSRSAFIVGSAVLVLATVYQVLVLHRVDPWILLALGSMMVAKLAHAFREDV